MIDSGSTFFDHSLDYYQSAGWCVVAIFLVSTMMWWLLVDRWRFWQSFFSGQTIEVEPLVRNDLNLGDEPITPEKFESWLIRYSPDFHRHENTIAVLSSALPLLGLLGTVSGMIIVFEVLEHNNGSTLLSGGISQALITTQAGLVTALPGLFFLDALRKKRRIVEHALNRYHASLFEAQGGLS